MEAEAEKQLDDANGQLRERWAEIQRLKDDDRVTKEALEKALVQLQATRSQKEEVAQRLAALEEEVSRNTAETDELMAQLDRDQFGGAAASTGPVVIQQVQQGIRAIWTACEAFSETIRTVQTPPGEQAEGDTTQEIRRLCRMRLYSGEGNDRAKVLTACSSALNTAKAELAKSRSAKQTQTSVKKRQTEELRNVFGELALKAATLNSGVDYARLKFLTLWDEYKQRNGDDNRLVAMVEGLEELELELSAKRDKAYSAFRQQEVCI